MQKRPTHAHSAPTRAGEEISVDALTRKFERLLGTDTPSWKSRGICKNARPAGAKKGLRTNKALVAAFGELFVERVNDADGNEIVHESNERAEAVEKLQDHDTDDELSFLINKFELDGESKQSVFMPYIT